MIANLEDGVGRSHAVIVRLLALRLVRLVTRSRLLVPLEQLSCVRLDARKTTRATVAEHEVAWRHAGRRVRRRTVREQKIVERDLTIDAGLLGKLYDPRQLLHYRLGSSVRARPVRSDLAMNETEFASERVEDVRIEWWAVVAEILERRVHSDEQLAKLSCHDLACERAELYHVETARVSTNIYKVVLAIERAEEVFGD